MTELRATAKRRTTPLIFRRGGNRPFTYEQAVEAFWSKVDKAAPNGCWHWLGAFRYDGYGHVHFQGKQQSTHKQSYLLSKGPVPAGLWVLHSCDNRKCVNPDHLRLGTRADNAQDAIDRKRIKGEQGKLTADDVRAIRAAYTVDERGHSNSFALSRQYKVHRNTIHRTANGVIHKDIA